MKTPMQDNMLDYLEEEIRIHFHFARILDRVMAWEPWKRSSYHVLAALRKGGDITRRFEIADGVTEVIPQSKGTVALLPASRRRRIEKVDDPDLELRVAVFSFTLFGTDLLTFWEYPLLFDARTGDALSEHIDALIRNSQDESIHPLPRIIERNQLCHAALLLIISVSRLRAGALEKVVLHRDLEPALIFLSQRFRESLTGDEIAACCRWSRSQFHEVFRKAVGVSPQGYQKQLRIAEAKRLLIQTDMGVAEVGQSVGWADPFHFSRTFKRDTGSAPSQFRTQFRDGFVFHV